MPADPPASAVQRLLHQIEPLIFARRTLTMAVVIVAGILLLVQMIEVRFDTRFGRALPLDHPYLQISRQYQPDFGAANSLLVALVQKPGRDDIYDARFMASLKAVTAELLQLRGIDRARLSSIVTADVIDVVDGAVTHRPLFAKAWEPSQRSVESLRADLVKGGYLGGYVADDQRGALIVGELLDIDPVSGARLDYAKLGSDLKTLRGRFTNPHKIIYLLKASHGQLAAGTAVGEDFVAPHWALALRSFEVPDSRGAARPPIRVRGTEVRIETVDNPQYNPDIDIHIAGFAQSVGEIIDASPQILLCLMLTLLVVLLLLWFQFGSFRLAILPPICALNAVIWSLGLLRLSGRGVDPSAIFVPLLIVMVSLSHGLQYLQDWITEIAIHRRNRFDASLGVWRRLAPHAAAAILAVIAGCALLCLIPIGLVHDMALFSAFGMLGVLVSGQVLLPILLTWTEPGDPVAFQLRQQRRDRCFDPLWRLLSRSVRPVPAACAVLVAAALCGWNVWRVENLQPGEGWAGLPAPSMQSSAGRDLAAIRARFSRGGEVFRVIAELDPEACVQFDVIEQVDRFAAQIENTLGVQRVLSLPRMARQLNAAFAGGAPKFAALPRNRYLIAQAITPVPVASGLLNADCSALPLLIFLRDHSAATLDRIVAKTRALDASNRREFYLRHADADADACAASLRARRDAGPARLDGARIDGSAAGTNAGKPHPPTDDRAGGQESAEMPPVCPVHFALASGEAGVRAVANQTARRLAGPALGLVYAGIAAIICLAFRSWPAVLAIVLPLALVSLTACAGLTSIGLSVDVATLAFVVLAACVGVDQGIYLYAALREAMVAGRTLRETWASTLRTGGKAVMLSSIAWCAGLMPWLIAEAPSQRQIGELLLLLVLGNLLALLVLLPAIAGFALDSVEAVSADAAGEDGQRS